MTKYSYQNELGQPIGGPVLNWKPALRPDNRVLQGRFCRVEPIDTEKHLSDLFEAFRQDTENRIWTYLFQNPFTDINDFRAWISEISNSEDPVFYAIIDKENGKAVGITSYLRIVPDYGVIEVGNINFSPALQGTTAATEAMFLMMQNVFSELGYRRYEWKCDSLNNPSRRAAERLGFSFEGIFRQAVMYKGRNRDTAWFAIIDKEWPALELAYKKWLEDKNFDENAQQRTRLYDLIEACRNN